jgi:NarL family two-component system sensor histidine kinase YdfH
MQKSQEKTHLKVERDPDLFVWFMTLVVAGMYGLTLYNEPSARQLGVFIPFTILVVAHISLHWQLGKFIDGTPKLFWYIAIQGTLALAISIISKNSGMSFALFMALVGEGIGLFGVTRRGMLTAAYYLTLLAVTLLQLQDGMVSLWGISSIALTTIFVVIYVSLYMRQHEAREDAQSLASELEAANRQLAEYAAQVENLTIMNERQRIARELHDTLSQGLAGIILQLEATEAHLHRERIEKAKSIVAEAMAQARDTLAGARNAIDDLRQTSLDDLDSALRLETSRFTNATDIPCSYKADQTLPLPDTVQEALIRSVAEALTNIAQHAQAKQVAVTLSKADEHLLVSVQDNGQGFDPSAIPSGHYGILGIRERVRLINGSVNIQSEIGKGTKVEVKFPLPLGEG